MAKRSARETDLEAEIEAFGKLADAAEKANQFAPAVSARAKVANLREQLARLREEAAAAREQDPVKRIRRLRRRAAEDGSWVAAATLAKQERDLVDAAQRAAEAAAKAARTARTPDELVAALARKIQAMPPSMQAKVRAELGWG